MTNCPNCGAPYESGATACRYCGAERRRRELPELLKLENFSPEMQQRRLEAECERLNLMQRMRQCEMEIFERIRPADNEAWSKVSTQTAINMMLCNVATNNMARGMCRLFNPLDRRME